MPHTMEPVINTTTLISGVSVLSRYMHNKILTMTADTKYLRYGLSTINNITLFIYQETNIDPYDYRSLF